MTASVMYNRNFAHGSWASALIWGRNHTLPEGENFNGYLAETTLGFATNNHVWARIENTDRTTELLLGHNLEPPGFHETFLARVQAYTFGYDRDIKLLPYLATAIDGQLTLYGKPDSLTPIYGQHPAGVIVFLRIRPAQTHTHSHHYRQDVQSQIRSFMRLGNL